MTEHVWTAEGAWRDEIGHTERKKRNTRREREREQFIMRIRKKEREIHEEEWLWGNETECVRGAIMSIEKKENENKKGHRVCVLSRKELTLQWSCQGLHYQCQTCKHTQFICQGYVLFFSVWILPWVGFALFSVSFAPCSCFWLVSLVTHLISVHTWYLSHWLVWCVFKVSMKLKLHKFFGF